jgi:diguanylate cyclase (GGDEF)-like protein/PAS domain S-box-containing protein
MDTGGTTLPAVADGAVARRASPCEHPAHALLAQELDDARASLREAEHRFEALAGAAPVGIFASEAGLRLGYANDRFADLLTLTPGAAPDPAGLLGTGWLDAVHPDDLPRLQDLLVAVLGGTGGECAVRVAGPTSGEGRRWIHLRVAPTTTPSRAAGFIGTAEDVTERRAWEERITYQAHHDVLTGLINRRRLLEVLQEWLTSRRGRDREFAVLFLDLDGFKEVNDGFGHDAGDRVLVEVARRLQRTAREDDILARVAGDEFVVLLRSVTAPEEAEAAARRHLRTLSEPFPLGRMGVPLSASIGVALPASYDTPESLLRAADRVMYDAKAAGRGTYRLAAVGPGAPASPDGEQP